MSKVQDAANFFIYVVNHDEDDNITNMKLNKLLYYAQGCYLSRTGKPLFDASIEAWKLGPVVPEIYQKYKVCGSAPIQDLEERFSLNVFSKDELDVLVDVMREYGRYTGSALVSMTHKSDTPWSKAWEQGWPVIPEQEIKTYFERHPVKRFNGSRLKEVSKFPYEWYDPAEDEEWEAYLRD